MALIQNVTHMVMQGKNRSVKGARVHDHMISKSCLCLHQYAPHGHVRIRHGRILAEGFYEMVVSYDKFLFIFNYFLAL